MFKVSKRFSYTACLLSVVTFVQIYWAMEHFADRISSADLHLGFWEDAIYMSLMAGLLFGILFGFIARIRNSYTRCTIQFIVLVSVWFFWNYTIFVERESSWSTYLFHEEIQLRCSPFVLSNVDLIDASVVGDKLP